MLTVFKKRTLILITAAVKVNVRPPAVRNAAHCTSEALTLAGQENAGQFLGETELPVGVIVIDQTKRNVNDRHLNAKFDADGRLKIADLAELRFIDAKQRILLNVAAKEKLLDLGRKRGRAAKAVAAAKLINIVRFRHDPSAVIKDAAKAALQYRCIDQTEGRQSARTEELLVGQEFTVDTLDTGLSEVKYRTDIAKKRHSSGAEDRNAVFHVRQKLRVAADKAEVFRKQRRIYSVRTRELTDRRDLGTVAIVETVFACPVRACRSIVATSRCGRVYVSNGATGLSARDS